MNKPDDYSKLKAKALRALARREHSYQQLQQKLAQISDNTSLIKQVLEECQKQNWLNELRFAQVYIQSRAQKFYGPRKIRYELQQRGLHEDLIDQAFEALELDWPTLAEQARQKKFGSIKANDWLERGQQQQYLYQRGF